MLPPFLNKKYLRDKIIYLEHLEFKGKGTWTDLLIARLSFFFLFFLLVYYYLEEKNKELSYCVIRKIWFENS